MRHGRCSRLAAVKGAQRDTRRRAWVTMRGKPQAMSQPAATASDQAPPLRRLPAPVGILHRTRLRLLCCAVGRPTSRARHPARAAGDERHRRDEREWPPEHLQLQGPPAPGPRALSSSNAPGREGSHPVTCPRRHTQLGHGDTMVQQTSALRTSQAVATRACLSPQKPARHCQAPPLPLQSPSAL